MSESGLCTFQGPNAVWLSSAGLFLDSGGMRVNYPCLWQLCVRDNAYLSTFSPVLKRCTAALSPRCRYQRGCFSLARRLSTWRTGDNEINLKKNNLKTQISRPKNWKWITCSERNSRLMLVWWTCSQCHLSETAAWSVALSFIMWCFIYSTSISEGLCGQMSHNKYATSS